MINLAGSGELKNRDFLDLDYLLAKVGDQLPLAPVGGPFASSVAIEAVDASSLITSKTPRRGHASAHVPDAERQLQSRREGMPVLVLGIAGVVIAALVLMATTQSNTKHTSRASVQAPNATTEPAQSASLPMPTLAIAAMNANVRKDPNTRSKTITTLARGATVEPIEITNGFVRISLADGRDGWVSRDVLVPRFDSLRLGGVAAPDYVKVRSSAMPFNHLVELLQPYRELSDRLLYEVANDSEGVEATISAIAASVRIVLTDADAEAVTWYSLEAKFHADKDNRASALESARAVVFADPSNVSGLVAFAYTGFKAGDSQAVIASARVLTLLAPTSTNTWVVQALSAASLGDSKLAAGSLALALRKSRNVKVTARVLADLAAQSSDPRVTDAVNGALERWRQSS